MNSLIRNILIIVVVVGLVVGAYIVFQRTQDSNGRNQDSSLLSSSTGNAPVITMNSAGLPNGGFNQELVSLLSSLQAINLDDSIFFNPAFSALKDISLTIPRQGNQGRPNPFTSPSVTPTTSPENTSLNATTFIGTQAPANTIMIPGQQNTPPSSSPTSFTSNQQATP